MDEEHLLGLVARAQEGDAAAMEDLLTQLRPLVLRRCAKFLPYSDDAEEAAQEALLVVAQKLHTFQGRGSFVGWVTVVSSNTARQVYRSMRRRFDERSTDLVPDEVDPRTTSVIAGTRLDLLDALEHLEREHPSTVDAFVLRDLGTLPYDEVAALTGAPLGTVKARIHTARRYLRERLGQESTPESGSGSGSGSGPGNLSGPAGI